MKTVSTIGTCVAIMAALVGGTWQLANGVYEGQLKSTEDKYESKIDTLNNTLKLKGGLQVVPPPSPKDYTEVKSLPEPTYNGFTFKKDLRIIDLRSRIPVPKDKKEEKISPVTWTRFTVMTKDREDVTPLDFEFGTTGILYPRCLTHEYKLFKSLETHYHGEVSLKNTWHIRVDLSEEQTGEYPFLLINEATYYNAFGGEESEWASITAQRGAKTELIGMVILFPEDKPFKTYDLYEYKHGQKKKRIRRPTTIIPSDNGLVFVWKIPNPKPGYAYQLEWTW
jgi:hypothetical protein